MTIYTYHFHQSFCNTLGISFYEDPSISDQVLGERPKDTKNIGPSFPIVYGKDHPHFGKPRPKSVTEKISASRKGQSLKPWTEERRKKTVASLTSRKLSTEHIEKMRMTKIGNKHSEETKLKMKEAQKRRRLREQSDKTGN